MGVHVREMQYAFQCADQARGGPIHPHQISGVQMMKKPFQRIQGNVGTQTESQSPTRVICSEASTQTDQELVTVEAKIEADIVAGEMSEDEEGPIHKIVRTHLEEKVEASKKLKGTSVERRKRRLQAKKRQQEPPLKPFPLHHN